ncbi:MAG: leucine-rich repeat protein [Lachnospiraceae bacterium]|nr:leucine-rich repeat protein [Lachnospiraceae bacterium]
MSRKRICAYLLTMVLLLTNTIAIEWNDGALHVETKPYDIMAAANTIQTASGSAINIQGTFGDGFQWGTTEDGTTLYISGAGDMDSFSEAEPAPWYIGNEESPYETVLIEGSVTSIGDYAFRHCVSMTSIEFPDTLTRIGNYAFDGCYSWEEVDLTGITSLGTGAFRGCGFEYVHIPESLKEMSVQVFHDCGNVKAYSVATGSALFFADEQGALFNNQTKTMLAYPRGIGHVDTYTIPEGITSLGENVFVWADIDEVIFPSTLTYFSNGCCWLNQFTTLTIPSSVTGIGQNAFANSWKLTSVTVPGNVKKIEQNAFATIETLTTVVLEDGVEWLHDYSFANNANLESITIPASVTTISQDAFTGSNADMVIKGYSNSTAELFAEEQGFAFESLGAAELETIASGDCSATEDDLVAWELYSNGELRISGTGAMADYGDHGNPDISAPWFWAADGSDSNRMKIAKVVIEDGVTHIGSYAFDYCEALSSVEYADSVTSIGSSAFKDTRWAAPVVKKNVTELGSGAFHIPAEFLKNLEVEEGNTSFVVYEGGLYDADKTMLHKWGLGEYATMSGYTAVLPSTLKTIGKDAFCGSIVSAVTLNEGLETIEERGFYNAHCIESLHLPSALRTLEKDALAYIDNLTGFTVAKGNTEFWADERGALYSADKTILYYYPQNTQESFYIIPDGVETIMWHAWGFHYLKGLLIPASVKEIEASPMYVYNPNNLDNRQILLYGYEGSVAEQYAKEHVYVTYTASGESIEKSHEFLVIPTKEYKRLNIHCPVDVYVYDTEGNVVASVVNEEVLVYDETIYADDMKKTVYLDNGIDYSIEIRATGEGTVSYSIEEVTEKADGSEITNVVEFNDIPIVANDTITSDISMLADAEDYVVSKNETSVEADKVVVDGVTSEGGDDPAPGGPGIAPEVSPNKVIDFTEVTVASAENATYSVDEAGMLLAVCDGAAGNYELVWNLDEPVNTADYYKVVLDLEKDFYNESGFHWYSIELYSEGKLVKSRTDICGGIIIEDDYIQLEIGLKNVDDCVIDEIRLGGWSRLTTEYSVNVYGISFINESEESTSDQGVYCEPDNNPKILYCFDEIDLSEYAGREVTITFDMMTCGENITIPANIVCEGTTGILGMDLNKVMELEEIELTDEWKKYQVTCEIPEAWTEAPVYFALAYLKTFTTGYDNGLCSVYYDNFDITAKELPEPTPEVTPDPTPEVTPEPPYNPPIYIPTPEPTPEPTEVPKVTETPVPTPEAVYNPETSWTAPAVYEEESKQYDIFIGTSAKDASMGRTIKKGETIDLNFYGVKNWSKDAYTYRWTTSDESIATVNGSGVVTMHDAGIAIIKLELVNKETGEVMKVAPVEVGVPAAEYDVFIGSSAKDAELRRGLEIGKTVDLNFYGVKDWKKDNYKYEWYSTDESIATVGPSGVVTAHAAGKVVIRLKLKDLRTGEYLVVAPVVLVIPEPVKEQ